MRDVVDIVAGFGDAVADAVERLSDALFGPPRSPDQPPPPRKPRAPRCKHCEWVRRGVPVVCERKALGMTFVVAEAERIVAERPRPVSRVGPRELWHYVSLSDVTPRHLAHVDDSKPGVWGAIRRGGRRRRFIIEGHHRAYNARRARRHFEFYQLTEEETARCLK